ncbi:hypothetical protein J7620_09250 [Wohlfahrtiimonas chitiniclastica]|uniref:hypothetical protein n=1 Tax=Wohlfahrtiimonas chitiniclastica TaxID=400946 RepID=UPI001BCE6A2E|nr:hypothetical protein [Wohlfahrtiimonas chitiniclastica]MBS7835134.1 hypothetical protein [Wohlfahrtiimonas chitiniclastica]
MIIYVNKADMRSYSYTPNVVWETIVVEVPNGFVGGAKTYDLSTNTWIDDPAIPLPTKEELKAYEKEQMLHDLQVTHHELQTTMNMHLLLDEQIEAAEIARQLKSIKLQIKTLQYENP